MTIRDSMIAWWVNAGRNPGSTLTCSETLCWVRNVSQLTTAGTQNGSYSYHLYYWGRKSSPGNKNNSYYGKKRCHQLTSHRPWRSSRRSKNTETFTRHLCKTAVGVTKTDEWTISWKPAMLTRCMEQKTPRSPQRLPMERGTPPLGLDTCGWKSSCEGMLQTEPYSGHNGRSSVSQNLRNEFIIWLYHPGKKKKKFPDFTVLFEDFTNWIFSLQGVSWHITCSNV